MLHGGDRLLFRIIPAYAGSTRNRTRHRQGPRDHPRIRGEHHGEFRLVPCGVGIIPAYAGSTCGSGFRRSATRDHPRIRGEHDSMTSSAIRAFGSSPHTRGARDALRRRRDGGWIIPAYAGSTATKNMIIACVWDHPRIRGEHPLETPGFRDGMGSSPHTRGARPPQVDGHQESRIIPAYAGSTLWRCPGVDFA